MSNLSLASIYETVRTLERVMGPFPLLIFATDREGRVLMSTERARDALGRAEVDILDKPIGDLVPGLVLAIEDLGDDRIGTREPVVRFGPSRRRARRKDGSVFPVEVHASTHRIGDDVLCVVALLDMTERLHADREMRDSRALLEAVLSGLPAMVSAKTPDGVYEFMNAFQADVFGLGPAEAAGRTTTDILGPESGRAIDAADRRLASGASVSQTQRECLVDAEGRQRVFMTTRSAMKDAKGAVLRVLSVGLDITHATAAETRLERLSLLDEHTGLPNRGALRQILTAQIRRAKLGGQRVGVVLLRISDLREIAIDLGESARDVVLKRLAIRLGGLVDDSWVIARYDDETFAVVLPDPEDDDTLARASMRLAVRTGRPIVVDGQQLSVKFLAGPAIYPEHGVGAEEVLRAAEHALRAASQPTPQPAKGRGDDFGAYLTWRREVIKGLRHDLELGRLITRYRPVAELKRGGLAGFEAALATHEGVWITAERTAGGAEGPDLLGIASAEGLTLPLMEWFLRDACTTAAGWTGDYRLTFPLFRDAVHHADLGDLIDDALRISGLNAWCLTLAIDEDALAADPLSAAVTLEALKARGIGLTLTGFGLGGLAMTALPRLPFDRVALGEPTIAGLPDDPVARTTVDAISGFASALGLTVTAQGVATAGQHAYLRQHGCDAASGPAVGKWLDAKGAATMIRNRMPVAV